MATNWPSDWTFDILVELRYLNTFKSFEWIKSNAENLRWNSPTGMNLGIAHMVWYVDENYSIPLYDGMDMYQYITNYQEYSDYSTGNLTLYGRVETPPVKVLDAEGVKVLFNLLSLQDYPNNDVLMAVVNAIDNTKLDKNNIFVGTKEEYTNAFRANKVPVGAIVVLTDIEC